MSKRRRQGQGANSTEDEVPNLGSLKWAKAYRTQWSYNALWSKTCEGIKWISKALAGGAELQEQEAQDARLHRRKHPGEGVKHQGLNKYPSWD
jgi:hypothetical protein